LSGRRDIFELHATDPEFLERFRKTIADVRSGKLPAAVAGAAFNMSAKSIMRYAGRQKQADIDTATYVTVSSWKQVSGVAEWETWMKGRQKLNAAVRMSAIAAELWEKVWQKKPLQLLTEQDIIEAKLYIKGLSAGKRFKHTLALRALLRFGFGDQKWLTKHLSTKGLKTAPRMPAELKTAEGIQRAVNGLFLGLEQLQLDPSERVEADVIFTSKLALWARTGDVKEEREIFGSRINAGHSHLDIDSTGRLISWEFFSKWREVWIVPRAMMPAKLVSALESFVRSRDLKTGDFLFRMKAARAREILKAACAKAGILELQLHDFRKMGLSACVHSGVPLEVAVDFGVGWKDINTARKHYLMLKNANATAEYAKMSRFLGLGETAQPAASENSALPQTQDAQQSRAPAVEQSPRSDANSTDTPAQ